MDSYYNQMCDSLQDELRKCVETPTRLGLGNPEFHQVKSIRLEANTETISNLSHEADFHTNVEFPGVASGPSFFSNVWLYTYIGDVRVLLQSGMYFNDELPLGRVRFSAEDFPFIDPGSP